MRAGGLWGPRKRQRAWQSFNAYICGMKRDILASQVCHEDRRRWAGTRVGTSEVAPMLPPPALAAPCCSPNMLMSWRG